MRWLRANLCATALTPLLHIRSSACLGCHGATPTALPSLSDLSARDIETAMNDYRSAAERAGISPRQAWFVLLCKHVHAVERYVKTGQLSSETIHSRLVDLANYAMLGDALAKDLSRREVDAKS